MRNFIKKILQDFETKTFFKIVFFLKDFTYHSAYKNYLEIPIDLTSSLNKEELNILQSLIEKIKIDTNKETYLDEINSILSSKYLKKSNITLDNEAEQILSELAETLPEDDKIRRYIYTRLSKASVSRVIIERTLKFITVTITTARPGIIIGKNNQEIDKLKEELKRITGKEIQINIFEIIRPELDAQLVATSVARQIESRISYRRAIKMAIAAAMRLNAKGIKIQVRGHLNGSEMVRSESYKDGHIHLSTFRADIDYALVEAHTTYGRISIKVWVIKGEVSKRVRSERQLVRKVGAFGIQSSHDNEVVIREIKLPNNITIRVVTDESNSENYKYGNPLITNKALDLIIRDFNKGLK